MKMKMKTNSNSLHKPEYRTYNPIVQLDEWFFKVKNITSDGEFDINSLEQYYTGKHIQIWEYPISKKDEIRRAYIKWCSYEIQLQNFEYINLAPP